MIPASASSRKPISRTISSPRIGCSWMAAYSSSVSVPVFCSTLVGTPSLPTSCSMPAYADLARDHDRAAGYPVAVTAGVEVLGLDRLAQRAHRGLVRLLLLGEL